MFEFSRIISTIDAHTAGEPLRIILSGLPKIPGATILEKRRAIAARHDHLRRLLMLEPRGHSGMYGCLIVPPTTDDGDFGVLFLHNEGYSTMCGHDIIAVTKVACEAGLVEAEEGENVVRIDAPAGRITSRALVRDGRVVDVSFENVLSFVLARDLVVAVDGIGDVAVDVAFGGAFYVYADAEQLGVRIEPREIEKLVRLGTELKHTVSEQIDIIHPLEPDIRGLYGAIICEPAQRIPQGVETKNVCIFADAQIDRSPTGTGTSGRLALLHARGRIEPEERLINRSIIDTVFWGRINGLERVGLLDGVRTEVGGSAYIMGFHQFVLEPDDPLPEGFRITGG